MRERETQIRDAHKTIINGTKEHLQGWGLVLKENSLEVVGHVLPSPELKLSSGQVTVGGGVYNMQDRQWLQCKSLQRWGVVSFLSESEQRPPPPRDPLQTISDIFGKDWAYARHPAAYIREAKVDLNEVENIIRCAERVKEKTYHNAEVLLCIWPHGTEDPASLLSEPPAHLSNTTLLHLVLPTCFSQINKLIFSFYSELEKVGLLNENESELRYWGVISFASQNEMESCVVLHSMSRQYNDRGEHSLKELLSQMEKTGLRSKSPSAWLTVQPNPYDAEAVCNIFDACGEVVNRNTNRPPQILLCLLPDNSTALYDTVKYASEILLPSRNAQKILPVQCLVLPKLEEKTGFSRKGGKGKGDRGYAPNVAQKVRA